MRLLTIVGTAAMLWIGGSIVIHSLKELGFCGLGHVIHNWADAAAHAVPEAYSGFVEWTATATLDGIFGLALGFLLIPVAARVVAPIWGKLFGTRETH